ncbi:MAG: Uma2 family endonuclease [Chloroflexota bacterium]
MSVSRRWTVADLEQMETKETERYEILDGELIVTHAPNWRHQFSCGELHTALGQWNAVLRSGAVMEVPGLVFDGENAVIPDLIWVSWSRLQAVQDSAGHLTHGPELVVEALSPGARNERRDRETKLALYAREGVDEYWVVDWQRRIVEMYRRLGDTLELVATVGGEGVLETPLLSGFSVPVARIWPPAL